MKKSDLRKTYDEHVIMEKSYKNHMKNLGRSYAKLMKNLPRHYRYLTKTNSQQVMSFGKPSVRGCYWSNTLN